MGVSLLSCAETWWPLLWAAYSKLAPRCAHRSLRAHRPLGLGFNTNLEYLRQYPVDDVLYWFRKRAGEASPPGQNWGWDNVGPDEPYGLRGSVAGLFMMGAGGATRWVDDADLHGRLSQIVGNISAMQESDGYAMAFPKNETNYHENPDCTQSPNCLFSLL